MKIVMRIYDVENSEYIDDVDKLMTISGQDPRMGFEAIAIQDDGTPIVCDKFGS